MPITIGVDVGGSHISCAAIAKDGHRIISNTYFHDEVDSKGSKTEILKRWATTINKSIESIAPELIEGIGFAMPGPFLYKEGIAMFEVNDKYEALYNVSIVEELPKYLIDKKIKLRFLNDASAFGLGSILHKGEMENDKVVAITLGTGFGAAFFDKQTPLISGESIPENGCLWDKKFKEGISDDYFSTRWFLNKYKKNFNDVDIHGVKCILDTDRAAAIEIFKEFNKNMVAFMTPYLLRFKPDVLIIGGSIAKSSALFLPSLEEEFNKILPLSIKIIDNTEEANIIGASHTFNNEFWNEMRNSLPTI